MLFYSELNPQHRILHSGLDLQCSAGAHGLHLDAQGVVTRALLIWAHGATSASTWAWKYTWAREAS